MQLPLRPLHLPDLEAAQEELARLGVQNCNAADLVGGGHSILQLSAVPSGAAELFRSLAARCGVACVPGERGLLWAGAPGRLAELGEALVTMPTWRELGHSLRELLANLGGPAVEWRGRQCSIPLDRPRIMGILNMTPDSFYGASRSPGPESALERARRIAADGADLIDVGGESTRPGAPAVSEDEECSRVVPVIEALRQEFDLPLSVDTTKSGVAAAALAAGANYVNDISGLQFDPGMAEVVAEYSAGLVVMHTRGRPDRMQADTRYEDLSGEVYRYLERSVAEACAAGIPRAAIAVDPGIGFGKDLAGNLALQRRLPELKGLGCAVLLGTSRKSFIGRILDQADPGNRLAGTLATVVAGVLRGAQIHRVHDVRAAREAADVAFALV